jgi:putative ABC transport system ATP-binding protein
MQSNSDVPIVRMEHVSKTYLTAEIETRALQGISLEIHAGEFVAVAGPSGCGKSTLLNVLGLLDSPDQGGYWLDGAPVKDLGLAAAAVVRNLKLGFVFQSFNLIADLDVFENVELPLLYRRDISHAARCAAVDQALERVGMSHRARHYPGQLSGGQQQRVAVARAVVGRPRLLLADEPTGNLDTTSAEAVMDLLESLNESGTTICMVTHDSRYAGCASRTISLLDGHLVDGKLLAA